MPIFEVHTGHCTYGCVVERGILLRVRDHLPRAVGRVFVLTTQDVWDLHGAALRKGCGDIAVMPLFFPGGEPNKRLACVEQLAEQMMQNAADRSSFVIGFGGGIVTDIAGFLAAIFMRGVPVLQIPTTLLAQVDAAVGGKTGVNLVSGKNLVGSFHQPAAVLIDPDVLETLSDREYRAGLFEVIKAGIIRDAELFELFATSPDGVLGRNPEIVDRLVAAAVRIKAEVVSADERESDLRRILNFGHTVGHAIEAETHYAEFLHGEAIAWGMLAATRLAELAGVLSDEAGTRIKATIPLYGPLPPARHLDPDRLISRLAGDKKTVQGKVHFVLPTRIGHVKILSGIDRAVIREAIVEAIA